MQGTAPSRRGDSHLQPRSAFTAVRPLPSLIPGKPTAGKRRDPEDFEVVVRLQPWGPTAQIRVTPDTRIEDIKLDALRQLVKEPAEPDEFELRFGNWPLDGQNTAGSEGLFDLAFVTLGLPEELASQDSTLSLGPPRPGTVPR